MSTEVKADSRVSWGDTDYSETLGTKRDLVELESNPVKAKEIEKEIKLEMTKILNKANKLYKNRPAKQFYDFLIALEMSNKALNQ